METLKGLFKRLLYTVAIPAGIIVACAYIFYSIGDIWFILATIGAFVVGAFAIFLVFKYWIDATEENETPEQQMVRFMIIFIVNLGINTEIVYFMQTYLGVDFLIAQTVAAVIVAYESYYAYRSLVFYVKQKKTVVDELRENSGAAMIK